MIEKQKPAIGLYVIALLIFHVVNTADVECRCHNRIRQRHPLSFFFTLPTPHHEARLLLMLYTLNYIQQTASGTETASLGARKPFVSGGLAVTVLSV